MVAAVSLAVALILSGLPPRQQAQTVRALAVQYADGRRTVSPLLPDGRPSWTTAFPRVPGAATDRDGQPLKALEFEETTDGGGITVTLALLYGTLHQQRVQVASVRVIGESPVRVDALEAFGVQPLVLSLVSLPPADLQLPSVTSPSSALEITMESVTDPVPGYHAVIVNHASRAVMMLAFTTYRGKAPMQTGTPRGASHTPLVPPGGRYVLAIRATPAQGGSGGSSAWLQMDRLVITSVLWSDDVVEGDPEPAAEEHAFDAGTALQLDRIVTILRDAAADPRAHPPSALRDAFASLTLAATSDEATAVSNAIPGSVRLSAARVSSMMAFGMRNAKGVALSDVEELLGATSPLPSEYAAWLTRILSKYDGWRRRFGA
jgi:hypothetical protein